MRYSSGELPSEGDIVRKKSDASTDVVKSVSLGRLILCSDITRSRDPAEYALASRFIIKTKAPSAEPDREAARRAFWEAAAIKFAKGSHPPVAADRADRLLLEWDQRWGVS